MIWARPFRAFSAGRTLLPLVLLSLPVGAARAQSGPPDFNALAADAATARDHHDLPRAIQLYTQAERLDPQWISGWWSLGLLQYSAGSWPEARTAFSHYIELSPPGTPAVAQAIALRGLCEYEVSDFPQSLADLEQSIMLGVTDDPSSAALIRLREAQLLTRVGRFEESLSVYGLLVNAGQSSRELLIGLGLAGLRNPQLPSDVPAGQQDLCATVGDATLRFMKGDDSAARHAFSDLFERFPDAPNAHYLYGYLLLGNDPDAAIAQYKRELEVAPTNWTAASVLAWQLLLQGKPAEALPFAQAAVSQVPEFSLAQLALGRALAETGNLPQGIEHLQHALQLQPDYFEAHVALASAYSSAGRPLDARRERLQSLQMAEAHGAAH